MQAALKLPRARDWPGFLAAARDLHSPPQSASYADVDGNIGFIAAGPRAGAQAGERPARPRAGAGLGRALRLDRLHPFRAAAARVQSARRRVVLANHKIVPPKLSAPHHLRMAAAVSRAAHRGAARRDCEARPVDASSACRPTSVSLAVRELLPRFTAANPDHEVMKKLAAWDGSMARRARRAADHGRVVARIRARALCRRAGRRVPRQLGGARGVPGQRALQPAALVRRRAHAAGGKLRAPADRFAGKRAGGSQDALRQRAGTGARRTWRATATGRSRAEPWLARFFDIRVPSGGDAYTVNAGAMDFNSDCGAVRQPPCAEPAADRRPGRSAGLGVHPFRRPVGQPAVAALPRLRGAVGARRIRADGHRAPRASKPTAFSGWFWCRASRGCWRPARRSPPRRRRARSARSCGRAPPRWRTRRPG